MPSSAKIEITGQCTLSCKFCYQRMMKSQHIRQRLMSDDEFNSVYRFVKQIPTINEIGLFYMGESGLHPHLAQFYKQVHSDGYFSFLTTNATFIDHIIHAIEYIDSLKVSWNYRSLDDFVNKTNATEALYHNIIKNISQLYDACHAFGKKLTISTILDSAKDDYAEILSQLRYDDHYWIPLQTQCGINSSGADGVIGESSHVRSAIPCWSLFKGLYVDVDMNVRTCCYGHNDCHILYNIKDNDQYILTQRILAMRNAHLHNVVPVECTDCLRSYAQTK